MAFDYATIADAPRATLIRCAAHIKNNLASIRKNYYEIGRQLILAKDVVPKGAFLKWCLAEFELSTELVSRYMRAARWAEAHPELAQHVPPSMAGLYLASTHCPPELTQEVVRHIHENGAAPPLRQVEAVFRERRVMDKIKARQGTKRQMNNRKSQRRLWEKQKEMLRQDRERRSHAANMAAEIICQLPCEVLEELKRYLDRTDGVSLMEALRHHLNRDNIVPLRSPHLMA